MVPGRVSWKKGVTTHKGRVVYNRKKHEFKLSDAIRILVKLNNQREGYFVPWNAIYTIAQHNMEYYANENQQTITAEIRASGETFEKFLRAFDDFLSVVAPVLEKVPGAGQLLAGAVSLYNIVRKAFPVY